MPVETMPIVREALLAAGAITRVVSAFVHAGNPYFVAALRDQNGRLVLSSWRFEGPIGEGVLERVAELGAGPISSISIAGLDDGLVATAVSNAAGQLRVIFWRVGPDGSLTRLAGGAGDSATDVAITAVAGSPGRVVTAIRDGLGNLRLTVWDLVSDTEVVRRASAQGGRAEKVSVASFGPSVATAIRDNDSNLRLIGWFVAPDGSIHRGEQVSCGRAEDVSVAAYGPRRLVTASTNYMGNFRLITWRVGAAPGGGPAGGQLIRCTEASLGRMSHISVQALPPAGGFREEDSTFAVTTSRDAEGYLRLMIWDLSAAGSPVRVADFKGDGIRDASLAIGDGPAAGRVLTAAEDGMGCLKITGYRVEP